MDPSGSFVAQGLRLIGQAAATAARVVRPDHESLRARQIQIFATAMVRHYLYAAVAPSRRAGRPHDSATVHRAQRFAGRVVGPELADRPVVATAQYVVFGAEDPADHAWTRRLIVHRTGLVELLWALEPLPDDGNPERSVLAVLDVLRPAYALAESVATAEYAELTTLRRPWRRRARVDWWFAVTTHVAGSSGPVAWNALRFPGESPPRADHEIGLMPPYGYGGRPLRSVRRCRPERVVQHLLEQLLAENGYYDTREAVQHVLRAVRASRLDHAEPRANSLENI